ncbi:hypothetical protein RFI_05285, partial [Reticulomyxa filosa]
MNKTQIQLFILSFFFKKKTYGGIFTRKHVIKTVIDENDIRKCSIEIEQWTIEQVRPRQQRNSNEWTESKKATISLLIEWRLKFTNGMVVTIRFIGTMHFATDEEDNCEEWDKHDGMYKGIHYFACPPKQELFVKEVKCRCNDDPSSKYLKRRCPQYE